MSILCDTSIIERCDVKAEVFDPIRFEVQKFRHLSAFTANREFIGDDELADVGDLFEAMRLNCYRVRTLLETERFVPMIAPFSADQIKQIQFSERVQSMEFFGRPVEVQSRTKDPLSIISRGLTSYGYDVSLAPEFKVFSNINSAMIDPKRLDPKCLVDVKASIDQETGESFVIMPPNSYLLGRTEEYFHIPRDIMVVCLGKSTYARSGGIVNVTPIEPGFEGNVVIEISNATNLPAKVYAHEGIAQFMFFKGDHPCAVSYGDRKGKYQGQTGVTLPKV